VNPRELRLPTSRPGGPDPAKLQRQLAAFGISGAGMPPPWVYECTDGALVIYNGVTRSYRLAKFAPGTLIKVEVVGRINRRCGQLPTIGDVI
jgi:hypothetical protein